MHPQMSPPRGRPPSTTLNEVDHAALALFARRGFAATTMGDIADAVGVSRRTLFRYYPSKNDIVWGDFASVLNRLGDLLAAAEELPVMPALSAAIVESNRYPADELPVLRARMTLITRIPALQAHAMLPYQSWRQVVARFVAYRRGEVIGALVPQTIGFTTLGASMAAFSQWVDHPDDDLHENLRRSFATLDGSAAVDAPR